MLRERYLEHLLHEKRCSHHTVDAYRRDLEQFEVFAGSLGIPDMEKASDRVVRHWMMQLMEQGLSPRTVNRKLSALRGFFRFARLTGSVSTEPTALIDPPRTPKRLPEFVEEGRMARLLDELAWPEGHRGDTHRLILELLYGTGMRLAELLGLRIADVDVLAATVKVLGKRNKERIIPLGQPLADRLVTYLQKRSTMPDAGAPSQALLVNERGEPLARRSVQRLVAHYLGSVTPQSKRSPHILRHTFATHMLDHGADLNAVKELLGHAGLAATQVYTHNTVEKLRTVHAKAHPRGGDPG